MVEGCRSWLDFGFNQPEKVTSATSDYQQEMDTVELFLGDYVVFAFAPISGASMQTTWCRSPR